MTQPTVATLAIGLDLKIYILYTFYRPCIMKVGVEDYQFEFLHFVFWTFYFLWKFKNLTRRNIMELIVSLMF